MAMNVFGNPISKGTLAAMPEYENKTITPTDMAMVAFNMKNARGNDMNVRQYVENVGKNSEFAITTLCVIYNATGGTLKFVSSHDWHGHLAESPYPVTIANGQWAGFVHVKSGGSNSGSSAGVVYRGKNAHGTECDWMMAWRNAKDRDYDNTTYTEIREPDHFQDAAWKAVYEYKEKSGLVSTDVNSGCTSSVSTGSGHKAAVEAIFSLENAYE